MVDLAGHTAYNRLDIFASKPARKQVTWLGCPTTTGLNTIDYIIVPPDSYLQQSGWSSETPIAFGQFYYSGENLISQRLSQDDDSVVHILQRGP